MSDRSVEVAPVPQSATGSSDVRPERRNAPRARVFLPMKIRPEDPQLSEEEVRPARNSSRDGIYFTSWKDSYYPGMRVRIVFPYVESNVHIAREATAEVVRVERLSDMAYGVAIRILMW